MKKSFTPKVAFLLFFISFHICTQAQSVKSGSRRKASLSDSVSLHTRPLNIFAEAGGPGLAISLNYDTRFSKRRDGWGFRIGSGYYGNGGNIVFTIPAQINYLYLFGGDCNFLEFGAGGTFVNSKGDNTGKTFIFDKVTGVFASGTIGYRLQPKHTGVNFRLAFVPIYWIEGFLPIGGLSIGYTFK